VKVRRRGESESERWRGGRDGRMDALFLVDRHARQQQLNADERAALRREHAQAWIEEIHSECRRLRARLLPKSALGESVNYTLNMWAKLRRCFDHAKVELSNNVAENSMRPVTLGRKNWLHVGSAQAGPKVAAILSVVESCRRLGLPVKDYLTTVLPGLHRRTLPEVAFLTPARWSASRAGGI
jgi:transposase